MGTAVVFFSAQGNAALAAKTLAAKLGAHLVELKEVKPRTKDNSGFAKSGFQAFFGIRTRLTGQPWSDIASYDELHIITPVWASKPAPAINTFLAKCNFKGKRVTLYTVQADPMANAEAARNVMAKKVSAKGGTVNAAHGLVGAGPGKGVRAEISADIFSL